MPAIATGLFLLLACCSGADRAQQISIIGHIGVTPLLKDEAVRKELKTTPEQAARLDSLIADMSRDYLEQRLQNPDFRRSPGIRRADEKAFATLQRDVADALTPEQLKRFVEIQIQYNGAVAFNTEAVQHALGLTDEQKAKDKRFLDEMDHQIIHIRNEIALERRKRMAAGGLNPDAARMLGRELTDRRGQQWVRSFRKAHSLLTDAQKATWKELTGKPFEGAERGPWQQAYGN